jgi:hypothetical protein
MPDNPALMLGRRILVIHDVGVCQARSFRLIVLSENRGWTFSSGLDVATIIVRDITRKIALGGPS